MQFYNLPADFIFCCCSTLAWGWKSSWLKQSLARPQIFINRTNLRPFTHFPCQIEPNFPIHRTSRYAVREYALFTIYPKFPGWRAALVWRGVTAARAKRPETNTKHAKRKWNTKFPFGTSQWGKQQYLHRISVRPTNFQSNEPNDCVAFPSQPTLGTRGFFSRTAVTRFRPGYQRLFHVRFPLSVTTLETL